MKYSMNWKTTIKFCSYKEIKISHETLRRWVRRSKTNYYPDNLRAVEGYHYVEIDRAWTKEGTILLFNRDTVTPKLIRELKAWGTVMQRVGSKRARKAPPPLEPELQGMEVDCKRMGAVVKMEHCRRCYLMKSDKERDKLTWEECRNGNTN